MVYSAISSIALISQTCLIDTAQNCLMGLTPHILIYPLINFIIFIEMIKLIDG